MGIEFRDSQTAEGLLTDGREAVLQGLVGRRACGKILNMDDLVVEETLAGEALEKGCRFQNGRSCASAYWGSVWVAALFSLTAKASPDRIAKP
ncbi:MAG: hypothetical protein HON70_45915 [Lentisphaerae bacterium]|nr:hypothetical protein [Lentisphaerota bacterium]